MKDFFISYTRVDRPWAEWIAWQLEQAGFETVVQAWDFRPGSNFVVGMDRASKDAERTLAVLSPDYLKSVNATAEWAAAFARDPAGEKGRLLPVRVREVELEGLLAQVVYVDLVGLGEAAARQRLLKDLARGGTRPSTPPPFPGRPPFPGDAAAPPSPEEADERLAALPLDDIPPPGPLPPGSRMSLGANPLFVGREDDLRRLARLLKAGDDGAIGQVETAATTGLGGIGKTQLACEFVHRYGRFFAGGVFWLSFADADGVPGEIAACGRRLGAWPDFDNLPLAQQLRHVKDAWQAPLPRLLVFDNCEDPELLARWRPKFGGCRVLVTSRRASWEPALGVRSLALATLPRAASVALLRGFRPDLTGDPALGGIAEEIGDLPLALHLAGSFLARYRHAPFGHPGTYLTQLREGELLQHRSLVGQCAGYSPTGHANHVGRTFALSYERLDPGDTTDALARSLLSRAVFFAPGEPIPRPLLLATVKVGEDDVEAGLRGEDALCRLTELGLMETETEGAVFMHRLVAAFMQNTRAEEGAQEAVEETVLAEANRLNNAGLPAPLVAWQSHLRAVTEAARVREDERAASLCNELGYYLGMNGDLAGALSYCEWALAIRKKVLGPEHPDTATSLNSLGFLLKSKGEHADARSYYKRALAIKEKVLGPEHPDTATSLNNLGALLQSQGDHVGARPYYERALAIREKVLGPEHPKTATSLSNLGFLLKSQGDYAGARSYYERALAIWEKALGPKHPKSATSLNNLGALLDSQGDHAGARPYYERALAIREKVLGPEHPDTALSLNNLGCLLKSQGDYAEARFYIERALAIWESRLGPDHPHTKIARKHLAALE